MIGVLVISVITVLLIILSSIFFPSINVKGKNISLYYLIALLGALLVIVFGYVKLDGLIDKLLSSTSMNPTKILILFISMTVISISLDELGFFKFIARKVLNRCSNKQLSIFLSIYFLVAFLTIFTSNDIVILTLTPFIISFSKEAKINPVPYLVSEFFSANTWSMFFLIGNPTNIYLTQVYDISFFEYLMVMWAPTIVTGVIELLLLLFIFRKDLRKEIVKDNIEVKLEDKPLIIINLIILIITTALLSISSYIHLEMYFISLVMMILLIVFTIAYHLVLKKKDGELKRVVLRAPYELIPYVLSMFVLVLALNESGITNAISEILSKYNTTYSFGFTSFISANLFNNIPMTILYSSILEPLTSINLMKGAYASIIGSNLGAIFTPLGALAGIMWMNILKKNEVNFKFKDFIKYGVIVSVPLIVVSLVTLDLMFL